MVGALQRYTSYVHCLARVGMCMDLSVIAAQTPPSLPYVTHLSTSQ